jgi:hypothetical protein
MEVADPMFVAELALELGMPIGELGQRMSNYELNVTWPAYFRARDELRRLRAESQ